ncbi:MAG: lysophospholipid acyltransferase family protein [Candidatus Krumholzibacteria bacterium]|nr:lysophospholipid acyltransferase family protein [Candidatus Krumholzibacteria bacterium]
MRKTARRTGETLLARLLIATAVTLPRRAGLSLFRDLGSVAYRCCRTDRERALSNLALAFPGAPRLVIEAIAKGSFRALGANVLDALRLVRLSKERVLASCTVSGEEHLRDARRRGRGVVVLTGHIGCWEMMAAFVSAKGYPVSVIARSLKNRSLDRILVRMRGRHGIESFERGAAAVSGFRALREGKLLGMLVDQDIDVDGIMVPFFGAPAHTPVGPAVFALRSGAAIVPMGIHLRPDGMHRVTILPELEIPPEELPESERVERLTVRGVEAIEALIRLCPQQWVWFHDRWRRRPETLEMCAQKDYCEGDGTDWGRSVPLVRA